MSLNVIVQVNDDPPLAHITIRRTSGDEDPWAAHQYEWRIQAMSPSGDTVTTIGTVEHLYMDGAMSLVRKVCDVANL
jgi:hypothetical protein